MNVRVYSLVDLHSEFGPGPPRFHRITEQLGARARLVF